MHYRNGASRGGAYAKLLSGRYPFAAAKLKGASKYPNIEGSIEFFSTPVGVVVCTEVSGLVPDNETRASRIYGVYIHNTGKCTGESEGSPSERAEYSYALGELPSLFANNGYAWGAVLTGRFTPEDIMGRVVVLRGYADADAFGESVACGHITRIGY